MGIVSNALYGVSFDAASMLRIASLMNTQPTFDLYYLAAMRKCVNKVRAEAIKNAPVLSGDLWRAITVGTVTPTIGQVGVLANVPYARRRELGFDGRTDILGRHFTLDPRDDTVSGDGAPTRSHMFYLKRALETSRPFIAVTFRTYTQMAVRQIIL